MTPSQTRNAPQPAPGMEQSISAGPSLGIGAAPVRIVLVGDSTACEQPLEGIYRGWGQCLSVAPGAGACIINRGKSGASTKTVIEEGLWDEALSLAPDWILIQLGHNDSHAEDQPESTRADGEYSLNLRRFITQAREIGAQPVLITPVRRFQFDATGNLWESESALEPYAAASRAIGRDLQVPVVDLFASSTHFFEALGPDGCNALSPVPGEDFSHFNEAGARALANMVAGELRLVAPELGKLLDC